MTLTEEQYSPYVAQTKMPHWEELECVPSGAQAYAEQRNFEKFKGQRVDLVAPPKSFIETTPDGGIEFNFHAGQEKLMSSSKRFVIALASRQSGKTESGAPWLLEEIRQRGPGLYMVVAPTYPVLFDGAYPKIIALFRDLLQLGDTRTKPFSFVISKEGEDFLYKDTPYENMPSKPQTIIRFCHGSNAASLEAKTALAVWIDEAGQEEFKLESFEAIEGRVSTTEGRILMTSTPYAFNWLYHRFYQQWEKAGKNHDDIDIIQWPSYYNPAFSKKEYERLKTVMPLWRWDMFYNGQFTRPAGLIYDCFDEVHHTCEPFEIPEHWPRYLGMDFGGSNTAAVYLAQDPDDMMLYLYRSYHAGQRNPGEHLQQLSLPSEHSQWDDFFERATGGQPSEGVWRDLYGQEGLFLEEPPLRGNGSVEAGIDIVFALLSQRRIKIFNDLEDVVREFNTYSREIDPETGDVIPGTIKDKAKFHLLDAVRYISALLVRGSGSTEVRVGERIPIDPELLAAADRSRAFIIEGKVSTPVMRGESSASSKIGNGQESQARQTAHIADSSSLIGLLSASSLPALPPPTFAIP